MIELIKKLAELQADLKAEEAKADEASALTDASIADVKDELAELEIERKNERLPYSEAAQELQTTIGDIQQTIIDAWDGERKTIETDAGTIKFRTTYSLKIIDEPRVLEDLMDHLATSEEITEYINGFNKTKLKAYMVIHPLSTDVAGLVPKTTVKLEVRKVD